MTQLDLFQASGDDTQADMEIEIIADAAETTCATSAQGPQWGVTDTDCTIFVTPTSQHRAKFIREMKYSRAEIRFDGRLLEVNRRCVVRDGEK
jgi:hypothetical protein